HSQGGAPRQLDELDRRVPRRGTAEGGPCIRRSGEYVSPSQSRNHQSSCSAWCAGVADGSCRHDRRSHGRRSHLHRNSWRPMGAVSTIGETLKNLGQAFMGRPTELPSHLITRYPELAHVRWRRGGLPVRVGGWCLGQSTVAAITLWRTIWLAPGTTP